MRDKSGTNGISKQQKGTSKKKSGVKLSELSGSAKIYSLTSVRMSKRLSEDRKHVDAILNLVKHYK